MQLIWSSLCTWGYIKEGEFQYRVVVVVVVVAERRGAENSHSMGRGELKKFKIKVVLPAREDDRMTRREEWNKVGEKRSLKQKKKKKKGWFFVLPPRNKKKKKNQKEKGEVEGMNERCCNGNAGVGSDLQERWRAWRAVIYRQVRCQKKPDSGTVCTYRLTYSIQSIHEQEHWILLNSIVRSTYILQSEHCNLCTKQYQTVCITVSTP